MKNIWIIPFSAIAISASVSSCSQWDAIDDLKAESSENVSQGDKKLVWTSFKAIVPSVGNGSRTSLEGKNYVYWSNGDAIAVTTQYGNHDSGIYKCVANFEGEKASTADFEGEVPLGYYQYFAFYPYSFMKEQENNMTFFRIPERQEAVAGSFANNLNPAWATTERLGGLLNFKNLGALVKFTIKDGAEDLESVKLFTNNVNVRITGDFIYDSNVGNTELRNWENEDAEHFNTVTLEGSFESGNSYYFVVVPSEGNMFEEGFKLVFRKKDGTEYVMSGAEGVIHNVNSSEIVNVGEVSLADVQFENKITDFNFISNVNRNFDGGLNWIPDDDGAIPLTSENLEIMGAVEKLDLNHTGLTSLENLKYFTGLKELDCSDNMLEYADLNFMTNLEVLYIDNSNVKELKVDKLKNMHQLYCYDNNLSELYLYGLNRLAMLSCSRNNLNALDLSSLSNLTYFYCDENNISSLDLSGNGNLRVLFCDSNPISTLDVANLTDLEELTISDTNISDIDISHLSKLGVLAISGTGVQSVDLSLYPLLNYFACNRMNNFMSELDFSNNPELTYLFCEDSNIAKLNLRNNVKLTSLRCGGNRLEELDLTCNTLLKTLNCTMQNIGEGLKLQLYLNEAQRELWNMIGSNHSFYVDVHFEGSEATE